MDVYFSTVVRAAPQENGGELVRVDWDTKKVLATVTIAPRDPVVHDPNPRGSTRGGRGVLLGDGEVLVASYHTIDAFDESLRLKRSISCHLFAGLHEVAWQADAMWASATCVDHVVKVDPGGRILDSWSPRNDSVTSTRFALPALTLDPGIDHRTRHVGTSTTAPGHVHLNAVALQGGRPLVLLNRFGCIVRLNPTEILVEDPSLAGCHNILVAADNSILVNDTRGIAVRRYDANGATLGTIDLLRFTEVQHLLARLKWERMACWLAEHGRPQRIFRRLFHGAEVARPLFVRGLCQTPRGTILVGISPAAILEIDYGASRVVDMFQYSMDVHVCVHGIAAR